MRWYLNDSIMGGGASGLAVQQALQQLLEERHLSQQLWSSQLPHLGLLSTVLLLLSAHNAAIQQSRQKSSKA